MQRHCRVEIDGALPAGLRDELVRRFGLLEIRGDPHRTTLSGLMLDQAGLRALLDLLWDTGLQITAVSATSTAGHPG
jgi:hypothetical protein